MAACSLERERSRVMFVLEERDSLKKKKRMRVPKIYLPSHDHDHLECFSTSNEKASSVNCCLNKRSNGRCVVSYPEGL